MVETNPLWGDIMKLQAEVDRLKRGLKPRSLKLKYKELDECPPEQQSKVMRDLAMRRHKKYGPEWAKENARRAARIRWATRKPLEQ